MEKIFKHPWWHNWLFTRKLDSWKPMVQPFIDEGEKYLYFHIFRCDKCKVTFTEKYNDETKESILYINE